MESKILKPEKAYQTKLIIIFSILATGIFLLGLLFSFLIALDYTNQIFNPIAFWAFFIPGILFLLLALILSGPYLRSLQYEIHDDEVIVKAGIWTKSVKHVPFRTITNITIKKDIIDRMLGIGSLNIQTAGMSGGDGSKAEEALVGLLNVQDIYEIVAAELRRFRGAMSPTAANIEQTPLENATLQEILVELKGIRQGMEK
ncbi:MAG: PH domain-containing protein [Anaerolineaceae bacterium]|nr:PH domain-containing protein [Anaerolineaceae bacterium]